MSRLSVVSVSLLLLLSASAVQQQPTSQEKQCGKQQTANNEAFFELCNNLGPDWIKFRGSCYRYFERSQYWVPAMDHCKAFGGNLVSITNATENAFVGKLTYCRNAWIGRYAVNVDRLNQPDNYRWTDGARSQYHEHDFTSIGSIHEPLISAMGLKWLNNVYHSKQSYVCKVPDVGQNYTCDCPTGWKQLDGYCYLMPPNTYATYIEADYYCRGRNAHLTSVHTTRELRAMSLLDVDTISCPFDTWVGLVKLNPCRYDFSTGQRVCFRWSDRSGNHTGFPSWHAGSPQLDQTTNCVLLKDTGLKSAACHTRARFVCKKPIGAA